MSDPQSPMAPVLAWIVDGGLELWAFSEASPEDGSFTMTSASVGDQSFTGPIGTVAYDEESKILHLLATRKVDDDVQELCHTVISKHGNITAKHAVLPDGESSYLPADTGFLLHNRAWVIAACVHPTTLDGDDDDEDIAWPCVFFNATQDGDVTWKRYRINDVEVSYSRPSWMKIFSVGGRGDDSYIYTAFPGTDDQSTIRLAGIPTSQFNQLSTDSGSQWTIQEIPGIETCCAPHIVVTSGPKTHFIHVFYVWDSAVSYFTLEANEDGWIHMPNSITTDTIAFPDCPANDQVKTHTIVSAVEHNGMIWIVSTQTANSIVSVSAKLDGGKIGEWQTQAEGLGLGGLGVPEPETCAYSTLSIPHDMFDFADSERQLARRPK
ncbi:hypothetical protein CB0940_00642 [Cercospora beticola]|uniref:Uncharacterized protein n=1 Tax=Cercospora beticola TaxID=122368 RepID=A0A2G5I9T8_CERBT|nr:hypothetical protein CB0940_00642 [Cercospora beticola]PIB01551.1 hypothetical protein CB0940_00642 [Cercospora beticola]WPA96067.1 hypothetical protein RHO25_000673 [Cercospora beticola]